MVHIVKLCVGISSVDELEDHRKNRAERFVGLTGTFHYHRTRMRPRRSAEIVGKGSLFWVIHGKIRCRQLIVDLRHETDAEGKSCCDIIMDTKLIRTVPYPKRPFQGWRYLPISDAPADLNSDSNRQNDAKIAEELAALGLI